MSIEQLIFLAVVQGITEFLPISSSGHLNLVHILTDWPDQGLLMDVAVHVGTLAAVIIYFWRDVWKLIVGFLTLFTGRVTEDGRLGLLLIVATLPTIVVGLLLVVTGAEDYLRTASVIAWANMVFALILFAGDAVGRNEKQLSEMTFKGAFAIGIAQIFSLIPGASRAGVTMTMARFLNYERTESARFSMLLSIPTILGAGTVLLYEVLESGDQLLQSDVLIGAALAFVSAILAIWGLMSLLKTMTMTPFVIYRVILGAALLLWVYFAG